MTTRALPSSPSEYVEREDSPSTQIIVSSWEPIDLGPVLRGERVTPAPTVFARDDGVTLFYPACLNSLLGETESGKTWVALIAIEQELHRGHHVILIDFEGSPESIVERLLALGVTAQQISEQFSYIQPDGKFGELEKMIVEDFIAEHGVPSLVVIDGITEAMAQAGLNPDVGIEVVRFYDGVPRWFARRGSAVAMIDHVTKSSEGRRKYAIGSERKISGLDGAAYIVELVSPFGRGKSGRVKLTVSKDRGGYVNQHTASNRVIAMVELRSSLDGTITTSIEAPKDSGSGPFRPTKVMEQMSKMIVDQPGIGTNQLRLVVGGSREIQATALELLVNGGFIEIKNGKNRSKTHTSLKPFPPINGGSEDDDS